MADSDKDERSNKPMDVDDAGPQSRWVPADADGRVVIPAAFRRLLGIEGGGHVFMVRDGFQVRVMGHEAALRRAQDLVAKYLPEGVSLVDDFLAERRREAQREDEEFKHEQDGSKPWRST